MFNLFGKKQKTRRIHLDYASTTPVHKEVLTLMLPYFSAQWANPSAIYTEGVAAKTAIEAARSELARTLRVRASDVTFTSGGTESNNIALIGLVEALLASGKSYSDMEIISTRVEHPSILETLSYLEKRGVVVRYVAIDTEGIIDIKNLEALLTEKTVLVTCAYVNSETGVIQDIKKISRTIRHWNEAHNVKILTHIDASQAPLWLSCELDMLGVDMMTLDAGKCYGPKGMGVLAHRHWVTLEAIMHGGGQEQGLRSGTENTALIIGGVAALIRAQKEFETRSARVSELRNAFLKRLQEEINGVVVNGSTTSRVANNINISISGMDTEYAVIWLDAAGIAASTKSACGSGTGTGSDVVRYMTNDEARAYSTLRFTLGEETVQEDIEKVVLSLKEFVVLMQQKNGASLN